MTKWEYYMTSIYVHGNINVMNKLGQKGWEMVGIHNEMMYFKRPIENEISYK